MTAWWVDTTFRVPADWPGHSLDITLMRNPVAYRAECVCGEWADLPYLDRAQQWCKNHKRNTGGAVKAKRKR